jgi:acylphosphatase
MIYSKASNRSGEHTRGVATLWRRCSERAMRSPTFMSLVATFRRARRRMIQTGAVIRRRVVAHGRVQGVFFRDTCRRQAWTRGVSGWVANREDGAVEAVFEGEPSDVQAMVDWARRGPAHAEVAKLEVIEEEPCGEQGFSVR